MSPPFFGFINSFLHRILLVGGYTVQDVIPEGGLLRGKIFLLVNKVEVIGHSAYEWKGQQLALGHSFPHGYL